MNAQLEHETGRDSVDCIVRICEMCDHGKSSGIQKGSIVACGKHGGLKHWGDSCPDWELIFSANTPDQERKSPASDGSI
jgi:hypothetical protein